MQIGLACDHGGFELKEEVKTFLKSLGIEAIDMGTFNEDAAGPLPLPSAPWQGAQ